MGANASPRIIEHLSVQGATDSMNTSPDNFFVALTGADQNPGTAQQPFATMARARDAVRQTTSDQPGRPVTVFLREGTHYLEDTLELGSHDSGAADAPVVYEAYKDERVTLSGGVKLDGAWEPYRDGIMMCRIPKGGGVPLDFTQLFVNGKRQQLARYPNRDNSDPEMFSGYAIPIGGIADDVPSPCPEPDEDMTFSSGAPRGIEFDPSAFTDKRWAKPDEATIHIFQGCHWGNLQWRVKDIDWNKGRIWFAEGGHQMGAKWYHEPCVLYPSSQFFVENVFEELDAPGEWYLDRDEGILYLYPEQGVDLQAALVEVPLLEQIIRMVGSQAAPVRHVSFRGLRFAHTTATFMDRYEIPSLGDWAICRSGAVFLEGTRECAIQNCLFDAPGGNAVFVNCYNRDAVVSGNTFERTGDSAICFVGKLETTMGTQRSFPYECRAENNLIHDCGAFGKQVAGVYISRAKRVTAGHNRIHDMPRAGICIGDGTWGGHVIEYNHISDTCTQTGDHGPFNAWGRDRAWCLTQSHTPYTAARSHDAPDMIVDAMEPVIVRHNFFHEKSGWGLDLDDGASNYDIYNNVCLGVSMKLREGTHRNIHNNIWVNGANSPCFHVGYEDNHDKYTCNITVMSVAGQRPEDDLNFEMGKAFGEIYTLIAPPVHTPWLEKIDNNCFHSDVGAFIARVEPRDTVGDGAAKYSLEAWQALGYDKHSLFADPQFVDVANLDFRVKPQSPALKLGFKNFAMGEWGLMPGFRAWA